MMVAMTAMMMADSYKHTTYIRYVYFCTTYRPFQIGGAGISFDCLGCSTKISTPIKRLMNCPRREMPFSSGLGKTRVFFLGDFREERNSALNDEIGSENGVLLCMFGGDNS